MGPIENRAAALLADPAREKMRACPASVGNPAVSGPEVAVPIEGAAAAEVVVGDRLLEPVGSAVEGTKLFLMIFSQNQSCGGMNNGFL